MINEALGDAINNYAQAFVDDIIIYSDTLEEHLKHIEKVFEKLKRANLKLKLCKCIFASTEITFLGHVITHNSIHIDQNKVLAIKNAPVPRNVREMRSFLGMANFHRNFIQNYANIVAPLTDLTATKSKFVWTDVHQRCFEDIKNKLSSAAMLTIPEKGNINFKSYCDASLNSIGAMLTQVQGGEEKVISYLSQKLGKQQQKWATIQKELYAVMISLKKYEFYLLGSHVDIFTDHKPLLGLLESKPNNYVLERWIDNLSRYNFTLHFIQGKENKTADYLSRMSNVDGEEGDKSKLNKGVQTEKFVEKKTCKIASL